MTSVSTSIFGRDLGRMAREDGDETKLVGRPMTDPNSLDEANYFLEHGITRAQAAERAAMRRLADFEASAVEDLEGEPPKHNCDVKGLAPQRARFARYMAWRATIYKEFANLETKRSELNGFIAAPTETESRISAAVRRTAKWLVGRAPDGGEESNRRALDDTLAAERHRADAAREALPEVEAAIERAALRVRRITEREAEFLHPAIVEIADSLGLGKLYLKKIAELREICALMSGLADTVGGYASGFGNPSTITFPHVGLPSISNVPDSELVISRSGSDEWNVLANFLLADPRDKSVAKSILPRWAL